MMRPLLLFLSIMSVVAAVAAPDLDLAGCTDREFAAAMRSWVSQGNRCYERSDRQGILRYAAQIDSAMQQRRQTGCLRALDELEFTADYHKLMGDYYYEQSLYDPAACADARRQYLQALDIYDSHSEFATDLRYAPMIHRELAQLYYRQQRYADALAEIEAALPLIETAYDNDAIDPALYAEIKTQQALCLARVGRKAEALSVIGDVMPLLADDPLKYHEALRKQGKIMMLDADCTDSDVQQALTLYRRYMDWARDNTLDMLSGLDGPGRQDYWMRMRPFLTDCYMLEDADPHLLYDAALMSKGLLLTMQRITAAGVSGPDAVAPLRYRSADIVRCLPEGSCAVEFVQYDKAGRQCMAALVLGADGNVTWVPVMAPDSFYAYKACFADGNGGVIQGGKTNRQRLGNLSGSDMQAMYDDPALADSIWTADLVSAIGDARRVYFAPDGYLHRYALEYTLPAALAGKEIYRLSSTRTLAEPVHPDLSSALLVGGVDFDYANAPADVAGNDSQAFANAVANRGYYPLLDGSLNEARTVQDIRSNASDRLVTGEAAREDSIRALLGQYHMVMMSTHAESLPAQAPIGTDFKPCLDDATLSQSFLTLAGVNHFCQDGSGHDPEMLDGLLSAREISELELDSTSLVILSACQSGLGEITSDGVYGLPRGFKNAGAGILVPSLWNVNDAYAPEFWSEVFGRTASGMPLHRAFVDARSKMTEGEYNNPRYINVFLMIDAIE